MPCVFLCVVSIQTHSWLACSHSFVRCRNETNQDPKVPETCDNPDNCDDVTSPTVRELSFLKENGRCMDAIVVQESTISQAGRGAFSKFAVSEGNVIAASPLWIIPDDSILNMYEGKWSKKKSIFIRNAKKFLSSQLLLNYCMGHAHSSLLLCPYAGGVGLINHSSENPNVKIQWAQDGVLGHDATLLESGVGVEDLDGSASLVMEYVALRDIEPGEELLMDYGSTWESEWNEHVAEWKPPGKNPESYFDAVTFNQRMKNLPILTKAEQEANPYPSNLKTSCHSLLVSENWRDLMLNDLIFLDNNRPGLSCVVLERNDSNQEYGVQITYRAEDRDEKEQDEWTNTIVVYRQGIPRSAIRFVDESFTTDFHMYSAFRHYIEIPDSIFPTQWKNEL